MTIVLTILLAIATAGGLVFGLIRFSIFMTSKKIESDPQAWKDSGHGQPGGYVSDAWDSGCAGGGDGD